MVGGLLLEEAKVQSDFITNVFPIVRYVLFFIILVASIVMIVAIMMQKESDAGMDAITGKQDSYYAQNKGSTREGKLKKITTIMAIVIAVSVVIYFITELVNRT